MPAKLAFGPLDRKMSNKLRFTKSAAAAAAATHATPDTAWSIQAVAGVQRHGSVCTDAHHQAQSMDMAAYPASPRPDLAPTGPTSTPADLETACADTLAAFALCLSLSLDMEFSPDEARWLVQSPEPELDDAALMAHEADTLARSHAPAAAEACPAPSPARRSPGALLAALRRCATAAHGKLTSCLARPATLEPECVWRVCTDGDVELSVNWS